jgi:predicted nucleic acid-binding protein
MLEILLGDRYSLRADEAFQNWLKDSRPIYAPSLLYAEVTSTIRERVYRGTVLAEEADPLLSEARDWHITIWDDVRSIQSSALEFATRFNRPKAYDAQYLALADLLECELWTADRRLVNAVAGELPWVRWIGEGA